MSVELSDFVNARLDEDEAAAQAAASVVGPDWRYDTSYDDPDRAYPYIRSADGWVVVDTSHGPEDEGVGPFIARHDPARVLREVAAKRAILEGYRQSLEVLNDNRQTYDLVRAAVGAQRVIVAQLASIWSDHADYREWKP